MPILYRLRLGRLLGHQFLLLTHRGRASGRLHATALKVLAYDRDTEEAVVLSMYGPGAGWVRNIRAHPAIRVRIAGSSYVPRQRFLTPDEAFAEAVRSRERHPWQLRLFTSLLGWGDLASRPDLHAFVERKPFVAFAPVSTASHH